MNKSISCTGCNFINSCTSPITLVQLAVSSILSLERYQLIILDVSNYLNHKFVDYDTHCNCLGDETLNMFMKFAIECPKTLHNEQLDMIIDLWKKQKPITVAV